MGLSDLSPAYKMSARKRLVEDLQFVDDEITRLAALDPSNRVQFDMLRMLERRNDTCADMRAVGFEPWAFPLDIAEAKAV